MRDDEIQLSLNIDGDATSEAGADARRRNALRQALSHLVVGAADEADRKRALEQLIGDGDAQYAARLALLLTAGKFGSEHKAVRTAAYAIQDAGGR